MSMIRDKKEKQVSELSGAFERNNSFYLVDFMGIPVSKAVELRKQMRKNSFSYKVVKNRLALRALRDAFPEDLRQCFRGPTAIAYGAEDPIGLARLIKDFSAQHKLLSVKGGLVEGHLLREGSFNEIASLTSRQDLLAKIGYGMAFPLLKILRTWQALPNSIGSMLSHLKTKK